MTWASEIDYVGFQKVRVEQVSSVGIKVCERSLERKRKRERRGMGERTGR